LFTLMWKKLSHTWVQKLELLREVKVLTKFWCKFFIPWICTNMMTCWVLLLQNLKSSAEEETFSDSILSLCHKLCFSLLFCSHHASNILKKSHKKRMRFVFLVFGTASKIWVLISYSNMQIMQKQETLASRVMSDDVC